MIKKIDLVLGRLVGENFLVNCQDADLRRDFIEWADKRGFRWNSGDRLDVYTIGLQLDSQTVYYMYSDRRVTWGRIGFLGEDSAKNLIRLDVAVKKYIQEKVEVFD